MSALRWEVFEEPAALAQRAVQLISTAAREAIAARAAFRLVAAGGSAPRQCYALLASTPQQWSAWQLFLGDERCLPEHDPERNLQMLRELLLSRVALPAAQIHCPAVERGGAQATTAYADTIHAHLPFDLVMLGLGEDGHTASLFPGRIHDPQALSVAVWDAPKPPAARVSMGLGALRRTQQVLVLASGAGKRDAVARWRSHTPGLPIVTATDGIAGHVLLDREAAG